MGEPVDVAFPVPGLEGYPLTGLGLVDIGRGVSGLLGQQVNFIQSKNSTGKASLTSDAYYTNFVLGINALNRVVQLSNDMPKDPKYE